MTFMFCVLYECVGEKILNILLRSVVHRRGACIILFVYFTGYRLSSVHKVYYFQD